MVLKAGRMHHRLSFQSRSTTKDAMGQFPNTFTETVSRMCSVEPLNGREFFAASGENSDVTTRIRVRYDATVVAIKTSGRIVDLTTSPETVYEIVAPPINDRNRELIFMCKV